MLDEIKKFYQKTELRDNLDISEEESPPVTYTYVFHKSYPRLHSIKLPAMVRDGEFERLLFARESYRDFSDDPLSFDDLAYVISSCMITDNERDPEKRTYPSAGARFPVELYVVSFNVTNLESGAYHYNIVDGTLEKLLSEDLREYESEIVSPYLSNTASAIILTSVIARSEVKYGIKAYPYSLIEAGHIGQNIQLACAKYNIGCCSIGGFVNNRISEILDITQDEIPIYVIGIGKRR